MKEYEEKYKQIFRYLSLRMSQNEISKLLSTSRNTIRKIKAVTDSIRLSWEDASKMTNEEFVHTIFPKNKNDNEELQPRPDCEMMYKELQKPGVTRTTWRSHSARSRLYCSTTLSISRKVRINI